MASKNPGFKGLKNIETSKVQILRF